MRFLRRLVVLLTYLCVPGFGSKCCDSSACGDLSNKRRTLVGARHRKPNHQETCGSRSIWWSRHVDLIIVGIFLFPIYVCWQNLHPLIYCSFVHHLLLTHRSNVPAVLSKQEYIQCRLPMLSEVPDLKGMHNDEHLLRILLAILGPEDRNTANNDKRRSYSMEHFRWGKPPGRKRRPIKVFASSQEGGDSSEVFFPHQSRRQRSSNRDEQGHLRRRGSSRTLPQLNQQGGKNETYQMNHFRWGSPNVSKRSNKSVKTRLRQLAKLFRTVTDQNVQDDINAGLRKRRGSWSRCVVSACPYPQALVVIYVKMPLACH